mmetsp:Transcript_2699/g.4563  ORF Transcript_2699/g.4563 Transcript_2699/m.4563 type:complete len:199 (+) Transcript_2699:381-977(+)
MDDQNNIQEHFARKFDINCRLLKFEDYQTAALSSSTESLLDNISTNCPSWNSTGVSIKTPQLTVEEQKVLSGGGDSASISDFVIEYSDLFLFKGSVEFKFRYYTKMVNWTIPNGIFSFQIDDVNQNVASDSLLAGLWTTVERDVSPGFHKLTWRYTVYNNVGDFSTMEDLAAEIEFIKIQGVSFSPKECKRCKNGVAD